MVSRSIVNIVGETVRAHALLQGRLGMGSVKQQGPQKDKEERTMESRRAPRITVQGAVAFSSDDSNSSQGSLLNLSTGGCAFECETLFQKGDYLGLRMYLQDQDLPVEVDLAAIRWSSGREYGLEFIRVRQEVQRRLRSLLTATKDL